MTFAGIPATTQLSGISFITTELAPITTLFPTVTFPIILAPAKTITLFPIVGYPDFLPPKFFPIVVPWNRVILLPIVAPFVIAIHE